MTTFKVRVVNVKSANNFVGEPKKDYPIYGPSILCKLNPKGGIL